MSYSAKRTESQNRTVPLLPDSSYHSSAIGSKSLLVRYWHNTFHRSPEGGAPGQIIAWGRRIPIRYKRIVTVSYSINSEDISTDFVNAEEPPGETVGTRTGEEHSAPPSNCNNLMCQGVLGPARQCSNGSHRTQ